MTAAEQIKSYAERILKSMAERDGITVHIGEIFTELKSKGHNGPALRKVLMAMRMDPEKRKTLEFDIDQYRVALGLADAASLDDDKRVVAAKMLADGKGVRETARATGVKKSTVSDLSGKIAEAKSPDTPKSSAAVAPVASPLPLADVGAFPPAALDTPALPEDGDGGIRPATPAEVAAIQAAIDRRNAAVTLPDHLRRQ